MQWRWFSPPPLPASCPLASLGYLDPLLSWHDVALVGVACDNVKRRQPEAERRVTNALRCERAEHSLLPACMRA